VKIVKQSIIFLEKKSVVQDVFTVVVLPYNLYAEKSKAAELVIRSEIEG
jgi:hypothetical protein